MKHPQSAAQVLTIINIFFYFSHIDNHWSLATRNKFWSHGLVHYGRVVCMVVEVHIYIGNSYLFIDRDK
jgi:hypothetical protein